MTTKLRKDLDAALMAYVKKFEKAHGVEHEWVKGENSIDSVVCFGDYFFTMGEIVYDVDNKLPVNLIFEWQDAGMAANLVVNEEAINLQSYAKGLRYEGIE